MIFAFEATRQPLGLLPLLAGCSASYLVMLLIRRHSIMTERLARRGTPARTEYALDFLSQVTVRHAMSSTPVTLPANQPLAETRAWIAAGAGGASHQGFPVVDNAGLLIGVVTRRDLVADGPPGSTLRDAVCRPPVVIYPDNTLRDAADQMVRAGVGRLAVVARAEPRRLLGVLTRSDLLAAHARRLKGMDEEGH